MWFAKKMVAHAAGAVDVEAASRQLLLKAKAIVETQLQLKARPYIRPGTNRLRIQELVARVTYAALGVHPGVFLDRDNAALLNFTVERRVRTILQMRDYVNAKFGNPEKPLVWFNWPSDVWNSTLSLRAMEYWEPNHGVRNDIWPFVLSAAGVVDPVAAVNSLFHFEVPKDSKDAHQVECQTAATMVALDSLLAAADPGAVLTSLVAINPNYVAIDYPDNAVRQSKTGIAVGDLLVLSERAEENSRLIKVVPPFRPRDEEHRLLIWNLVESHGIVKTVEVSKMTPPPNPDIAPVRTNSAPLVPLTVTLREALEVPFERGTRFIPDEFPFRHFLSDTESEFALFDQGFVPLDDLQPGDIVHVLGHPLVRNKIKASPYGGERCVIVDPWASTDLIRVTGHGIGETTILELLSDMLQVGNRLLSVARVVLTRCLTPAMTAHPVASGRIPTTNAHDADAVANEKRIKEAIAQALNIGGNVWTKANFFTGTWRVFDLPLIQTDQLADFDAPYPRHWALAAEGTVHASNLTFPLQAGKFFAFAYSLKEFEENDPDVLAWPKPIDSNFVGLLLRPDYNAGATDRRRQFCIQYWDEESEYLVALPLYQKGAVNAEAVPTMLKFLDLGWQPFKLASGDKEAWVIRPRVTRYTGDPYVNYLRRIGALPSTP